MAKEAIINNEIKLSYPEHYDVLSGDEMRELYKNDDTNRWVVRNKDEHVTIAVLWQSYNRIVAALADLKSTAVRNEQLMSNGLRAYNYKCDEFISEEVCGQKAQGYCYEYEIDGIIQHAKTLLFKAGKNIYGITCYTRGPMSEYAANLFGEVLASIEKA